MFMRDTKIINDAMVAIIFGEVPALGAVPETVAVVQETINAAVLAVSGSSTSQRVLSNDLLLFAVVPEAAIDTLRR